MSDDGSMNEKQDMPNIHGMLPPGAIKFQPPTPNFPPDLSAALDAARKSDGKYMVAVWHMDDNGDTLHMQVTRGSGWNFDWTFRGFAMFRDNLLAAQLPGGGGAGGNGQGVGNN